MKRSKSLDRPAPEATTEGRDLAAPADPEAVWRTLRATGLGLVEAAVEVWRTGDPVCRAFAVERAKDLLVEAAPKPHPNVHDHTGGYTSALSVVLDRFLGEEPELGNAAFQSCAGLELPGKGNLDLGGLEDKGMKSLERLPNSLRVPGSLRIKDCPLLRSLGQGLRVKDYLRVRNCPQWDGQVHCGQVGWKIDTDEFPIDWQGNGGIRFTEWQKLKDPATAKQIRRFVELTGEDPGEGPHSLMELQDRAANKMKTDLIRWLADGEGTLSVIGK